MVAGEAEDEELVGVTGCYFFIEGFEAIELWGEAAFGGSVDDENDFAFEVDEGVGITLFCEEEVISGMSEKEKGEGRRTIERFEVVKAGGGGHGAVVVVGNASTGE